MGGSSGSAPKPDPRMGEAAMMAAKTGEDALAWMQKQAEVTNGWAETDRARYQNTFVPLQNQFIREAKQYDTPGRRNAAAREAVADIRQNAGLADKARMRQEMAMGIDPSSGRSAALARKGDLTLGLASAGASNMARRRIETEGRGLRASAVNLGNGMAVNPGTSMGLSNSAGGAGFGAAASGYNSQASILGQQQQQEMQAWQTQEQARSSGAAGLGSALGSLAGAGISMFGPAMMPMLSDEDAKTDKSPSKGNLKAIRKMRVDEWRYKDGLGDGAKHTGTYAQDFQKATGRGDGRTIPVVDAVGVTMGAVKELSEKVDRIGRGLRPRTAA